MGSSLELWGDTSAPLPILEYVCLDDSWLKLLPKGSKVVKTAGYGVSLWSQSGKIEVRLADGTTKYYFIKLTETKIGLSMSRGEFESLTALHKFIPNNVPEPIGWGTFESSSDLHFFLAGFIPLNDETFPPKNEIAKVVADLHTRSRGQSPNGKFGFHVPTWSGTVEYDTRWTVSWEEFFSQMLRNQVMQERRRAGPSDELESLLPALFDKVIPRLLRPLETGGNDLQPSLIHGDLYHGNTARDVNDARPIIFDTGAFWAHFEFDMHSWKGGVGRYIFDADYIRETFKHDPPSEPKDEWEDRHALYFLNSNLNCSCLWPQSPRYRRELIENVRALVDKFPDGYTGGLPRRGDTA